MSLSGSPPPPAPAPTPAPTPTPGPDDAGDALGPPDASTSALGDALHEPVLTDIESGADHLLSTAVPDGLSNPFSAAQGGWIAGSQPVDPYTNMTPANGPLGPFVGQDVDPYTSTTAKGTNPNAYTSGQDVNPFAVLQNGALPTGAIPADTSQWLASNGPMYPGDPATPTQASTPVQGELGTIHVEVPAVPALPAQATAPGSTGNAAPDSASNATGTAVPAASPSPPPDSAMLDAQTILTLLSDISDFLSSWFGSLSGAPSPAPAAPVTPAPSTTTSISATTTPPAPAEDPWWAMDPGSLVAAIAGLFSPASVGAFVHPQTPAGLPPGLQQMTQMNATMARQALQEASNRTREAIGAAGVPYAAAMGVLAAPAAGSLSYEASLRIAARFPLATAAATQLGNALTGTTVPRAASAAGGIAAGARYLLRPEKVGGLSSGVMRRCGPRRSGRR